MLGLRLVGLSGGLNFWPDGAVSACGWCREGKVIDFPKAVRAEDDETEVFSWIEGPDKATRDAALAKITDGTEHPAGPTRARIP